MTPDEPVLPTQWHVWRAGNVGDSDPARAGQYLQALKGTRRGERMLVVEGESQRGVIGVVDFSGDEKVVDGRYFNWGAVTLFDVPVSNAMLREHELLATTFAHRQGRPRRLASEAAEALSTMVVGGLPPSVPPATSPAKRDRPGHWTGVRGVGPEAPIEDQLRATRRLWKAVGFTVAPAKEQLGNRKVPDLISHEDAIVGDVKAEVRTDWGPAQLEGYLAYLDEHHPHPGRWRGLLVHEAERLSPAVKLRLDESPDSERIEVWSSRWHGWRWKMVRQYGRDLG